MYLLKDLWYGNINPGERYAHKNSTYKKISLEANQLMEKLMEELSPEGEAILEKYCDKNMALAGIAEEDTFIRGVRIGAQFILDVIGDYKSELLQMSSDD